MRIVNSPSQHSVSKVSSVVIRLYALERLLNRHWQGKRDGIGRVGMVNQFQDRPNFILGLACTEQHRLIPLCLAFHTMPIAFWKLLGIQWWLSTKVMI